MRKKISELTPKVCDLIRKEIPISDISVSLGIGRSTFYFWMARGRRESTGEYSEFTSQVDRARQEYEDNVLRIISEGLESGFTQKEISNQLGITPRTFCNWISRGESRTRKTGFYHRIVQEIERVDAERYDRIMKEVFPKHLTTPRYQQHLMALGKAVPKTTVRAVPK